MSLDTQLRDLLDERLGAVQPPYGDLAAVERAGRRIRRRRHGMTAAAAAVALAAVVGTGVQLLGSEPDDGGHAYAPLGPMDFSHGLRAYADPGRELHIGGRTVPVDDLPFLDTDALATAYGVVFYRDGDLLLVQEDGTIVTLDEGEPAPKGFHPTAKGAGGTALVAYVLVEDSRPTLKVLDLGSQRVVESRTLDCTGTCDGLVLDGFDAGNVFVRTDAGTSLWHTEVDGPLQPFAGRETRVADARGGVVLYSGERPDLEAAGDWMLVAGSIDAQLTFDGRYVLDWSSRLEPTRDGDRPLRLDEGPLEGLGFWTIDTDGSVLVAAPGGEYPNYLVFDCEVPSGTCAEVGPLTTRHGDPMFIGSDM